MMRLRAVFRFWRIGFFHPQWRDIPFFVTARHGLGHIIKPRQRQIHEARLQVLRHCIAKGHKDRVRRVIVLTVKRL